MERYASACRTAGVAESETVILVSVGGACQYHFFRRRLLGMHLCSTARLGVGEVENSNCTPRGLHLVASKKGDGLPEGTILRGRVSTGISWRSMPKDGESRVTTRLLWLRGLEPGRNAGPGVDTYERYIYIHGTNRVDRLGSPASSGCVLLRDEEVVPLYDAVPLGSHVWISEE